MLGKVNSVFHLWILPRPIVVQHVTEGAVVMYEELQKVLFDGSGMMVHHIQGPAWKSSRFGIFIAHIHRDIRSSVTTRFSWQRSIEGEEKEMLKLRIKHVENNIFFGCAAAVHTLTSFAAESLCAAVLCPAARQVWGCL